MSIDYDGRTFRPTKNGSADLPGALGRYTQRGDLIEAVISGGAVRTGHLVATADADGVLDAAYCLVLVSGEVVAGRCESLPTVLPDGRLRLTERWRRDDGSIGVTVIEEVPA